MAEERSYFVVKTAKDSELIDVTLKVLHETEKAYLVTEGLTDKDGKEKTAWLPKSQVEGDIEVSKTCTVTMPRWLFEEKGFTPDD